jgi:hypothetical protein
VLPVLVGIRDGVVQLVPSSGGVSGRGCELHRPTQPGPSGTGVTTVEEETMMLAIHARARHTPTSIARAWRAKLRGRRRHGRARTPRTGPSSAPPAPSSSCGALRAWSAAVRRTASTPPLPPAPPPASATVPRSLRQNISEAIGAGSGRSLQLHGVLRDEKSQCTHSPPPPWLVSRSPSECRFTTTQCLPVLLRQHQRKDPPLARGWFETAFFHQPCEPTRSAVSVQAGE